jgi:hypothetical protein
MANYVKSTNFTSKDSLPTGDPLKVVKGTEIDVEFNNIATAVTSKADSASPTFSGTPFAPTASPGTNTTQIATTAFVVSERNTEATLTNKTLTTPKVDVINEATSAAGVTVDGVLLKDGSVASSALGSGTPSASTFLRGDRTWASGLGEANVQTFNSSGTWTKPLSGTMARIQVWGGGAGGSSNIGTNFTGGGGGGGYNEITVPLSTLGSTVSVTVGAGGAGRTGSTGLGLGGGSSNFGGIVRAGGAPNPVLSDYFMAPQNSQGGNPLTTAGVAVSSSFSRFWSGGFGGANNGEPAVWGGGGGGGWVEGGTASTTGGVSIHGGAGGNGLRSTTGIDGTAPGGGGGGRNNSLNGGNGAAGRVVVTVW